MHAAIKLDRKLGVIAVEIDYESFDHLLTPEVKPVDRISAEGFPENALGRRHLTAQAFGERQFFSRNTLDARYFTAVCHERVAGAEEPNP